MLNSLLKTRETKSLYAKGELLVATIIWGSTFFILKDTLDYVPMCYVLAFRFALASIILAIVFRKKLKEINKEYWIHGGIIGGSLFVAYLLQTAGLQYTTPGKNAFLTAAYCVMVPFLYWISDRIRPTVNNVAGAILCMIGIGLISISGGFSFGKGEALSLSCALFYALQILFTGKYTRHKNPVLLTLVQFIYCTFLFLIMALLTEDMPRHITPAILGAVTYLAIFGTLVGLLLQNMGQKNTSPSSAAIILSLEAVFGVFFSVLFYSERLTPRLILGFALIFVAEIIAQLSPGKKKGKLRKGFNSK